MNTGRFSELGQGQALGSGKIEGSVDADLGSIGVAIVIAGMFALLGIWLYRLGKNEE